MVDLVGALQRLIDALHDLRHAIRRIQTLVRIHLPREVGVGGHLPAAEIDCFQPRAHLLHGLVARQRAQRGDVWLGVQQIPQALGAQFGQRALNLH